MELKTGEEYVEMSRRLSGAESQMRGLMCPPDDERDRERIESDRMALSMEMEVMRTSIAAASADVVAAARALTVSYPCAGARDGCRTRVRTRGDYCRRCAFDAD